MVRRDKTPPKGPVSLTNENTQLDTTWETVVGDDQNYPGFAYVFLLSYRNLDSLKDNTSHQSQQLMSSAATVSVSNSNTTYLPQQVNLTFHHLQSSDVDPTCVYWSDENEPGVWSGRGCTLVMSNSNQTVCSCNHLSTFALMSEMQQGSGQLSLVMWVGVVVALTCVVLSLITTLWCRFVSRKRRGGCRLQQDLLVNTTDVLQLGLQSNGHRSSSEVTKLLRTIEISIRLIAPLLTENVTRIETNHTEVEIMVRRDKTPPEGPVSLTNENTQFDTTWETVVGDDQNYPGFAYVFLLSYRNLDSLKDNTSHQSQQLMSSAATVSFSNSNTTYLPQQVNLTFHHLQSSDVDPTCVYWSDENEPGVWSGRGCTLVMSNSNQTVCSCNHLSTFALMSEMQQGSGQLSLVMWVGVVVALTCVVLSLITTLWCRFVSRKRRGGRRLQQDVQLHRK
ncbi:unnamed protein product [Oncorhynchus mykiss]|uniref:GAIN-B domain-containing protein n=1 Tax=Oncorhynchus mykiss TaxID=8022 RepID=A0A060YF79_ONCMY|nr:unnamed protein product [Oncorhynchus mykiss]